MKKIIIVIGLLVLSLQSGILSYAKEREKQVNSDVTIEKQVDQIMDKYIGKKIPGASIGIVEDGKVILTKGYGVSDSEKKIPVTGDQTVFSVASITKTFTWSALMKLAEEGKVDLNADIQDYLPEGTLNLAFDKKITILNLMTHTAGFEEKTEGMDLESVHQYQPLKKILTKENQPKQVYEPGTVTSYSNYSTNLAGYIIEQVTGQDYISYMNKTMLTSLQMNHSTFSLILDDEPMVKENLSLGYVFNGSSFDKGAPFLSNDIPAGSLLSTADDMTHFILALLNDKGTEPYRLFEQTKTLDVFKTQSHSIVPGALGNAHGFWEKEINGKRILEHGGNSEGFSAKLSFVPKEGRGYILLTNVGQEATGIRDEIETLIYGAEPKTADLPLVESPNDQKVTGRYRYARQPVSTMGKLAGIVVDFDMDITKNTKGGINVSNISGPGEGKVITQYVEVKPGIYQNIKNETNDINSKYLYFGFNEKGQVTRAGSGVIADYLPVTSILDTQLFNFVAFGISFVAFLSSLLYLVVKFIKQKRKNKANSWSKNYTLLTAFSAIGLLVMITAVVMIFKYASNLSIVFSSMQALFYINWLLPLFTTIMIGWLAVTWRKNEVRWLTLFLIMIGLLTTVQFYNVHLFF